MNEQKNLRLELAQKFVDRTGVNLFLTGRAGTGKTTFLKNLTGSCLKPLMVTAPTGVAAINARGVTLHSFFQLPFGPAVPGAAGQGNRFFRFSREKKAIIKGLELLIIDEISMVRADLLDAVDDVLRRLRRNDRPFGGVQLLLIGDLFQLPPVARAEEWELLSAHYASPYFFSSLALQQTELVTLELTHVYRQSDPLFIDLLNKVRENRLDDAGMALLSECEKRELPESGTITLTTHNRMADAINRERLAALDERPATFSAEVKGTFPDQAFPGPADLTLKKGAQVMFLKNDPTPEKRYYNGKIGRVTGVSRDQVIVTCGTEPPVEVKPQAWENVAYTVDGDELTRTVVGTFRQLPLKPAWAVTIHKSQGLTFDRAKVDAAAAFSHGQTYVALSRCRSLEGLELLSPISRTGLGSDPDVAAFMEGAVSDEQTLLQTFEAARTAFFREMVLRCFDFSAYAGLFFYFMRLVIENENKITVTGLPPDLPGFRDKVRGEIFEVGEKFVRQLQGLMAGEVPADTDPAVQDRTAKAFGWFSEKMEAYFAPFIERGGVETDNKALSKQMANAVENLKTEMRISLSGIRSCSRGFDLSGYLEAVSRAALKDAKGPAKKAVKQYVPEDIAHPELFAALRTYRNDTAKQRGVPAFQVMPQKVLVQIAAACPGSLKALQSLKGVGPATVERYGKQILKIVGEYAGLDEVPEEGNLFDA